jgi:hypothetical protein
MPVNRISDMLKFGAAILQDWRRRREYSAASRDIGLTKARNIWEMLDECIRVLEPLSLRSEQFLAKRNCAVPRQRPKSKKTAK